MKENTTTQKDTPVMLSIRETADRFNLPVHFIRSLVAERKVYAVQAGSRKFYINITSVADYLSGRGWYDQKGGERDEK